MIKILKPLVLGLLLGSGWICMPSSMAADPQSSSEKREASSEKPSARAEKAIPFQGTVSAVNAEARTFTLSAKTKDSGRLFRILENTQILQNDEQASFEAITVGEMVRGQAFKKAEGWEAKKVMIGPKSDTAAAK